MSPPLFQVGEHVWLVLKQMTPSYGEHPDSYTISEKVIMDCLGIPTVTAPGERFGHPIMQELLGRTKQEAVNARMAYHPEEAVSIYRWWAGMNPDASTESDDEALPVGE